MHVVWGKSIVIVRINSRLEVSDSAILVIWSLPAYWENVLLVNHVNLHTTGLNCVMLYSHRRIT